MQRSEMIAQLQMYIVNHVLDGKSVGLDETTPLLEWGVINSIEIVRLLSFVRRQFAVDIPAWQIVADNFANLGVIADMIMASIPEGQVSKSA